MANVGLSGGDKLEAHLRELLMRVGGGELRVGILQGATYPPGRVGDTSGAGPGEPYPDGLPVAQVAFWNEFGVPEHNQPPRPFFRDMIRKESPSWGPKLARLIKYSGSGTEALKLLGEDMAGALKQSIMETMDPPNAPSTAARKKFKYNKPLVDTGHMANSVGYEVK